MTSKRPLTTTVLACMLLAMTSGCAEFWAWIDNCANIVPGAIPRPNGAALDETFAAQANKAEAEDFVIHEYEWVMGTADPDFSGVSHLEHLIPRLDTAPYAIVIARTCYPELDQARRAAVITYLLSKLPPPKPAPAPAAEVIPPGVAEAPAIPDDQNRLAFKAAEPAGEPPPAESWLAQRVVIGFPPAEGLRGQEAVRIAPGAIGAGRGGGGGQTGSGAGFSGASSNVGTFNFR